MNKTCIRCEIELTNVHHSRKFCEECNRQIKVERSRIHRTKSDYKEKSKAYHLMRQYKMTKEDVVVLAIKQNFQCAICYTPLTLKDSSTHIDHDHVTNKVRGILCTKCNMGLGLFLDSADILANAIWYLKRNEK